MKKFKYFIMPICLMLCSMFFLFGCGEEFILEQSYNLIGMQIIVDNTVAEGYHQYEQGEFTTYLSGAIDLKECTINVKRSKSVLTWNHDGIKANYTFVVISGNDEYPTFSYSGYTATYNGVAFESLNQETMQQIASEAEDVLTLDYVLKQGETSIQLLAQKRNFSAYINIINRQTKDVILMAQIYGINA